jgi:tagatose 1,6-diphosphate aldolase
MSLSIGKIRGLQRIAGESGIFTICALDHRGSLEKKLCPGLTPEECSEDMTEFKMELCRFLAPHASAVLLDPIFGAAQAVSRGLPGRDVGLLVSLEETGYQGSAEMRQSCLLNGWSVRKIKLMAADAVKLLIYYRPDSSVAGRQRDLVAEVATECQRYDLPCLVEALSYPVGREETDGELFARLKPDIVIQTARDLTALPVDILKAEFPAELDGRHSAPEALRLCQELNAASAKPWVLLSAGTDYNVFIRQVEIACRAGASGFLAGRAVWQEAVSMAPEQRRKFVAETAVPRLKKLVSTAEKCAEPWTGRIGLKPEKLFEAGRDWYQSYGENAS